LSERIDCRGVTESGLQAQDLRSKQEAFDNKSYGQADSQAQTRFACQETQEISNSQ